MSKRASARNALRMANAPRGHPARGNAGQPSGRHSFGQSFRCTDANCHPSPCATPPDTAAQSGFGRRAQATSQARSLPLVQQRNE
eukprot:14749643-Alexandrium_andersonii.AAC.1